MSASIHPAETSTPSWPARLHAWRLRGANVEFALLGMAATAIAFHSAILLDLKAPATAAITVWVVANTRPGHVVSKSIYRVLGTIAGATAGVTIVATLNSMPWLLFTALALWIAVCTGIGNLFSHFRTYFGLLAGYTTAFIVLGAYSHPDRVLDVALDRTSAIVIGVLSISLVVSVAGVRRSAGDMGNALREMQRRCLDALRDRWDMTAEEVRPHRLALARAQTETIALLEFAELEQPGHHHRSRTARALTGILLHVLDVSRIPARRLEVADAPPETSKEVRAIFLEIREILEPAISAQDKRGTALARTGLEQLLSMVRVSAGMASTTHAGETLGFICHHLDGWIRLLSPEALRKAPPREPFRRDLPAAGRHVLRSFLGLMAAIAFWNITGWQEGAFFLINGAAFCALSSSAPDPAKALLSFATSSAVAAVAGFFCKFFLLPQADGFLPLMICLAVVLVPIGCLAFSRHPRLDITGFTGGLFMLALMQPSNHMTYDPAAYISSAIAAVFSGVFLSAVFSVILPVRPEKEPAALLEKMRRDIARLAGRQPASAPQIWRMMAHRHLRNLQSKAATTSAQLAEGLRLLDYGSSLLRLEGLPSSAEEAPAETAAALSVERAELRALSLLSPSETPSPAHDSGI